MKKYILLWLLNLFLVNNILASTPLWTFTPLTPTSVYVTPNTITDVRYLITNQSSETHTIALQPFPFRVTSILPNSCGEVFTLGPNESCILAIFIAGLELSASYIGGPTICESSGILLCYTPSEADVLTVIFSGHSISLDKKIIRYSKNDVVQSITIINDSAEKTIHNVQINLKKGHLDKYLMQNANDCKNILPKQSCTIYLERINGDMIPKSSLEIQGDNIRKSLVRIKADGY